MTSATTTTDHATARARAETRAGRPSRDETGGESAAPPGRESPFGKFASCDGER